MIIRFDTANKCTEASCIKILETIFNGVGHIIGLDGNPVENQCSTLLLDNYRNNYIQSLNRRRHRLLAKSADKGYIFEQFEYSNFIPDIVEINISKEHRSGGPLKQHYRLSVIERGGYPTSFKEIITPVCKLHQIGIYHGIFTYIPGYKQGNIITNKKLVAYNGISVCGELSIYSWNIGHGNYLADGIMTMLTVNTVLFLLREYTHVKYLVMGNWTDGLHIGPGLQDFKREHLFQPVYLIRTL